MRVSWSNGLPCYYVLAFLCDLEYGEGISAMLTTQKRLSRLPDIDRNISEKVN